MLSFTSRSRFLGHCILTGLAGAVLTTGIAAQQRASQPDFSSNQVGWIPIGGDFIEVPGEGSPLVRNDPRHPYVVNGAGAQPTYRIADLTTPNLKPWAKERMKKDNDEVLAGKTRLYGAIELQAGWRSNLHDVQSFRADLFPPNT
jgi:hypothetical protein